MTVNDLLKKGIEAYEAGCLKKADDLFKQILVSEPGHPDANHNLGVMALKAGKTSIALGFFGMALRSNLSVEQFWLSYILVLVKLGEVNKARNIFKQAKEMGFEGSRFEELEKQLVNQSSNINPLKKSVNALIELCKKGEVEEAGRRGSELLQSFPDNPETYNILGTVSSLLTDHHSSTTHFKRAVALKPNFLQACFNLGTEFNKLERYEEAIACFSKAITLNPVFCEAHNNLGLALHQLERFDESISSYKKAIEINVDYDDAYYNLGLVLLAIEDYVEASKFLKKRDDVKSQSYLLRCLYFQRDKHLFCEQLDSIINRNYCNALIGSLCSAASIGFDTRLENPFCSEPLNFVSETDLSCECDFEDIFINPSIAFMDRKGTSYRKQKLLKNGTQTSGNLFLMPDDFVKKIESVIRTEVTKYKLRFGENEEGFMKYWPPDYTVFGWFVKLRRGGALTPHIHENGWLSGSIYINVPKGLKGNDGKLVVCMGEDQQGGGHETQNKRFIDVETGTLCLFPSSLFHYTIPFESEEERLVLAFDIIPK